MEKVTVIKDEPVSFGEMLYPGWAEPGLWTRLWNSCLVLPQLLHFSPHPPGSGEVRILCSTDIAPPMPLDLGDLLSRAPCVARYVGAAGRGEGLGSSGRGEEGRGRSGCNVGPRHPPLGCTGSIAWHGASCRGHQVDSPLCVPDGFNTCMPGLPGLSWSLNICEDCFCALLVLGVSEGCREATGSRLGLQPNPNALCLVLIRAPVEVDKARF